MCKVAWCDNKPNKSGKGYCRTHYDQMRKYGRILDKRTRANRNDIIVHETFAEVLLRNKDGVEVARAIIDLGGINIVKQYKWSLKDNGYVRTVINRKTIYLHRLLMKAKDGDEIDHINLNKLDNRRQNLRFCTHAQNCWNRTSEKRGVQKLKRNLNKKYRANITVDGETIWLGYYLTEKEALEARVKAERKYQKEFRCKVI